MRRAAPSISVVSDRPSAYNRILTLNKKSATRPSETFAEEAKLVNFPTEYTDYSAPVINPGNKPKILNICERIMLKANARVRIHRCR